MASTRPSTASLLVTYPAAPGKGRSAARLETAVTAPPPAATREGRQAWETR
jgi:hypothetical protein